MLMGLLWTITGRGDKPLRWGSDPNQSLKVQQQSTPSMTVDILAGAAFSNSGKPYYLAATGTSGPYVAPSGATRIDVIEVLNGALNIVAGTEGAGEPSGTAGATPIASITIPTTATVIKDTDDATNGFITDKRVFD
jgi:hypothetical protein